MLPLVGLRGRIQQQQQIKGLHHDHQIVITSVVKSIDSSTMSKTNFCAYFCMTDMQTTDNIPKYYNKKLLVW